MTSRLLVSTIVAASLLVAPVAAFAQSETASPAPESKSEATPHKAVHHAKATHMKRTTVGMSSSSAKTRPGGEAISRKPAD